MTTDASQGGAAGGLDRATALKVCAGMHSIYKTEARVQRGEFRAPPSHLRPDPDKTADVFAEIAAVLRATLAPAPQGEAARMDALDSKLMLALMGAEVGSRGRLSEGCVQLRIETVQEIRDTIRALRGPALDVYRDCICSVIRSPNRDDFARRGHNPNCPIHADIGQVGQ